MKSRVYRNLNTGLWSIQQKVEGKWLVVCHAESCMLMDVTVRQSEAARQKVIAKQCRDVHCWVTGTLIDCTYQEGYRGREPEVWGAQCKPALPYDIAWLGVTYNPYVDETLVYRDDGFEYKGSKWAHFSSGQKMEVM